MIKEIYTPKEADVEKRKYSIDYVDTITAPGINKILSDNDASLVLPLKSCADISINKHGSKIIAVCGHYDCGGNPAGEDVQREQIRKAVVIINSWNFNVKIIGLWINENWIVEDIGI